MRTVLCIIVYPVIFLILIPIDYPLWKEYKKQGYDVPNYFKFVWDRNLCSKIKNHKRKKKYGSNTL